ncbi:MAG: polysaccharide biosynthesis protein [Gemmatimonadetes bacterium]|nr:polysaccharide biosynthesis protein [Gemmatimonadota bacterium]
MTELRTILHATLASGVTCFAVGAWLLPATGLAAVRPPLSQLLLDMLLTSAVVSLPRFLVRAGVARRALKGGEGTRRVLIAGAGTAGGMLVKQIDTHPRLGLIPVGFVDDDLAKQGHKLHGLPVLGTLSETARVCGELAVDELLVAMPTVRGEVLRALVTAATASGVRTRTLPSIGDILSGKFDPFALRQVEIQDLLRREPVRIDLASVQSLAMERTVLVTGAGGSIGSELCRQVAGLEPARLVLVGHGENSIFGIQQELTQRWPHIRLEAVIADVKDAGQMRRTFERWQPYSVFHAAAHKHVPLMEDNIAEAVRNNILGTRNVVTAAAEFGVEHLVMISTDKAVRPTSVMGATKRVAEQLVQMVAEEQDRNFVAVRFGNVLGSRGSVVPTFLKQIADGGPVTVTHPEMRRYFMTIPEAVQLVLQAGALGQGGEVFVLDMGEPVKIADLAADLIRLSGKEVERHRDPLQRHAARRKLYEELFFDAEHASPTGHSEGAPRQERGAPHRGHHRGGDLIHAAEEGGPRRPALAAPSVVPDYEATLAGAR